MATPGQLAKSQMFNQQLTGQSAANFLNSGPQTDFSLTQDGTTQRFSAPKSNNNQLGILGDIAGAFINPFADLAKTTAEGLNFINTYQPGGDNSHQKSTIMNQQEWADYIKNPLGKSIQSVAGVGS